MPHGGALEQVEADESGSRSGGTIRSFRAQRRQRGTHGTVPYTTLLGGASHFDTGGRMLTRPHTDFIFEPDPLLTALELSFGVLMIATAMWLWRRTRNRSTKG